MCRGKVSPDGPIKELTNNPQPIRNIYDVDTQTATYLGSVHHKVRKSTVDPALMVNSANFVSSSSSNNIPTPTLKFLEFVLRQPKLAASLQEFLDNEFCIETLLFIQKVDEYQKQLHEMNLSDEIQRRDLSCFREEILSEFLLPTSENEVNVPAKIKQECMDRTKILRERELEMGVREFRDTSFGLFENCRTHIALTLIHERFGRFLTTESFRTLSQGINS